MLQKLYSVRDLKSEFWSPRVAYDDDSAVRDFSMSVSNTDSVNILNFAPGDFELYYIGTFDTKIGVLNSVNIPQFICRGSDCVRKVGFSDEE